MSFYGDIKRVQSSPYVFDKIYPNRLTMELNATSDGVYIGRYVLVKYTCKYENDTLVDFNKYVDNPPDGKMISQDYSNNANTDIGVYKDTFDGTVWLKIYTNITTNNGETIKEKYILISELNAAVPRLELVEPSPMPKYIDDAGEHWRGITIDESASSEDAYKISIPEVLLLEVGESGNLFDETLLNPRERSKAANKPIGDGVDDLPASMFDSNNNYMKWKSFLGENEVTFGDIQGKKLETKLNGLGQAISDIYDALFGVPSSGSGDRPFFTDDISGVLGQKDKGLVGVLSAITTDIKGAGSGDYTNYRIYLPGTYYYFVSRWGDATEDPDNFIENIPRVIGSSIEYNDSKAHYEITDWALSDPKNV